mgnify:CR=1 FL=1
MMLYASSFLLSRNGRHEESIANAQKCVNAMGKASNTLARLGAANAVAGNVEAAEAILLEMESIAARRHISPYHLALVNCGLGRTEEALDLLERAHEIRDAKVLWMGVDPELDSLHGHPRFNDLLRKLNHRLGALPTLPARSPRVKSPSQYYRSRYLVRPLKIPVMSIWALTHGCLNHSPEQCATLDRASHQQRAPLSRRRYRSTFGGP